MRYDVVHETRYEYESPVTLSQQLLHLTPRKLPWQSCLAHRIEVEPTPTEVSERLDYFGNPLRHILLAVPHPSLVVFARSSVEVASRGAAAHLAGSPPWTPSPERRRSIGSELPLEAAEFLFESPHVEYGPALAAYAAPSFRRGRPLLEAALDLNRRIHRDFEFDVEATSVATPLPVVLEQRRGVCQDFAHLMIGCLRTAGVAARYVSGYILTAPPPDHPRLIGADASHAWVSVFCPKAGWVDFDPTNDCLVDDQHVTLAWGRDFSDVTPMRGVILGGGEQRLEVRVTVTSVAETRSGAPAGT